MVRLVSDCGFGIYYFIFVFQQDQSVYQQKVKDMIADGEIRLIVNINDLRKKNQKRATE